MTWNAPEFNVFSRRPFAGGETLLVPVFRPPDTYEQAVESARKIIDVHTEHWPTWEGEAEVRQVMG